MSAGRKANAESKAAVTAAAVPSGGPLKFLERPWALAALLALAAFLVYLPATRNEFVNYDDPDYVSANRHVQQGLTATSLTWALTAGHASNWHPLTWVSHMIDWQLFGDRPAGHHLVSVLLHALNSALLFLMLREITGRHWRSALVAAFFALHPLRVESVAWISERKDVLSTVFWILSIWAYALWTRGRSAGGPAPLPAAKGRWGWYGASLAFFALGLMSKPMLVTLPFVLLLLDIWPLERLRLWELRGRTRFAARLLAEKTPFFALSVVSSIVTVIVQKEGGAVSTALTLSQRLSNAAVSYARYLGKLLWPENLSVLYPHPGDWPGWVVAGSVVLLLAITAAAIGLSRRRPYVLVGWLLYLGTLVPVIGLVQVGIQSMADRYAYVPTIGVFMAVIWGLADLAAARRWQPGPAVFLVCVALAACAALTASQVAVWRTSETLFRHAVEATSKNYLAYNNLGYFLSKQGRMDEALRCYEQSLQINPQYEDALNNIGHALAGKGRHADAISYYERALRTRPEHVEVHNNLGNSLSELGRIDEAIEHYRFVLNRKADHPDAHNNLGIALAMKGQLDEAIDHFRAAIKFRPGYASAHSNLGNAFAVQKKLDLAVIEYRESLRLNRRDSQAHNNLANVLSEQGKFSEAISHYREALAINPDNPDTRSNYAVVLTRAGNREEALKQLQEALRLNPDYAPARRQLEAMVNSGAK